MSVRLLVTECFEGNHEVCGGFNGPAIAPNFLCACDCHKTDGERLRILLRTTYGASQFPALIALITTIRAEARRAALREAVAAIQGARKEAAARGVRNNYWQGSMDAFDAALAALEATEKGEGDG